MRRYIQSALLCVALSFPAVSMSQVTVSTSQSSVIEIVPPATSGLDCVYVVESTHGLSISYTSQSASRPVWMRFDNRGGGFAESVDDVIYTGATSAITSPVADCGYIIEDGSIRSYFWITDYSAHALRLDALSISSESDCTSAVLSLQGNAGPIRYYSINGMPIELSRDMTLTYQTLSYDEAMQSYQTVDAVKEISSASGMIYVDAPLCSTLFSLDGDRFLRHWSKSMSVESDFYQATAVQVHTEAVQTERDNDNEQHTDMTSGFGGSAPCEMTFMASVTDAVVFKEWQIASDADFNLVTFRDNSLELNHTFRDEGVSYVRFAAANAAGDCEAYGDVYEVSIGASDLKCPNAFSPGSSEGINDVWKVSYKSIISFECAIFNRWGVKITSFNDPAQGWDGKYKGKLVGAGVYYYVIKAKGADGKKYNLSGDINIVGRNPNATTGTGRPPQ